MLRAKAEADHPCSHPNRNIDAAGMLVLPGFVDTHRHTWQATVRGIAVDWTLAEYFHGMRGLLGLHFRPEDVYAANLLGVRQVRPGRVQGILAESS